MLPLVSVVAVIAARLRRSKWAAFMAPRLRRVLLQYSSPLPRWLALGLLLAASSALITALARPQAAAGTRVEKSVGRNLLVALDVSRSMRVRDVAPDRMSQAKMVIYELLDAMPNERVGLIGFAGNAYVYAPLTVDHPAVRETVEQIDESWVPLGGSDLAAAVRLGIDTLHKTGQKNNALVIISDGENNEGELAPLLTEAARSGVYILAIGVGTADGAYVPSPTMPGTPLLDRSGQPVVSRLQPEVLRQLATETNGRYAVAGSGMDIPALVKSAIKDLDAFEMDGRERNVAIEFYQWLVLPAIFLLLAALLAATRWRRVAATALAIGVFLTPSGARADAVASAKDAIHQQRYPAARDAYHQLAESTTSPARRAIFLLGEAYAAYLGKDYSTARAAYSRALLSEQPTIRTNSFVGMGNTLFQLGWQSLADASYPSDPKLTPNLEEFDRLVKTRLATLKEAAEPAPDATGGYASLDSLITNWADSVRHFDSALANEPSNKIAAANRQTTMIYLKRLAKLLEEERQQTAQALPQPTPGEGQPQPGQGDPKEQPEAKPNPDQPPKAGGDTPPGEQAPKDGKDEGKQQPSTKDQSAKDDKAPGQSKPNETPEQRARRILEENADLEKGPLTPGRREFRPPAKDW